MRRMIKKWGEALLAALCVLAIVFAACIPGRMTCRQKGIWRFSPYVRYSAAYGGSRSAPARGHSDPCERGWRPIAE